MRLRLLATAAALLWAGPAAAQLPADLDATVARAMDAFQVPGVSIAAVKHGEVVLLRGYGVRQLGGDAPVDEHTVFGIGSNTKAITATLIAMLVDEGKLAWDDRVAGHLPEFALADTAITRQLTIRDLIAHRSGLGTGVGDLLVFPASDFTRDDIMARMRALPLRHPFRGGFRYNNLMYLVAGAVIESVTGRSWEDNVRERIFAPLGMRDGATSGEEFDPAANWATPHRRIDGELRAVQPAVFDNGAPAGSISASAADLARWMMVQLDSGRLGTRRLWSAEQARELWTIQNPITPGPPPPELPAWRTPVQGYALGFLVREYRGTRVVYHSGEVPGYFSHLYLLPDSGIGVAVLTSAETAVSHALAMTVVDALLGAEPSDWVGGMIAVTARGDSVAARYEAQQVASRDSLRESSLPFQRMAGRYVDPWYGEVELVGEGRGLVMRFAHTPALIGDVLPWGGDTFLVQWRDRSVPDALGTFEVRGGAVQRIHMRAFSPRAHFRYDFQDLDLRPARN